MNRQHIEDILPLTPMQQSMFYQYLRKPESKLYFEQIAYRLTGEVEINRIKEEDRQKIIDLSSHPFRVILCKLEENKSEMIVTNHHILFDGWSTVGNVR